MERYPRVTAVEALPRTRVRVTFDNGEKREYDCRPLLQRPEFSPLRDDVFFSTVHPDPQGYGIIWNDDVDLAESELWLGGRPA